MISKFFKEKIKENFPFEPTQEQEIALDKIVDFLFLQKEESIFLLRGFAGTGKSSLLGALVKTMTDFKQKTVLLAPTGRAAKVFSSYSNHPAFTIHKKIYRQQKYSGELGNFGLMDNLHKDTLFIVDEASMISNNGLDSYFGTGRLLDDLIHFVYSGENCRILLIGDTAQLPPVGEEDSPALQVSELAGYGLEVHSAMLSQIVRQAEGSGILRNATAIRNALTKGKTEAYPKLKLKNFADIVKISGEDLIDEISSSYDKEGLENTMIISRSNKRCNIYNQGVRNRILYREEELSPGDMLMITKNNYYWTENVENVDFLANGGEIVEVLRVRREQDLYGFRFCEVLIRSLDYDIELEVKILMDTLHSDAAGLTKERSEELFLNVLEDYADISTRAGKMKKLKVDPFYNALQVKFAYAVTCHKAQGGEWRNVFLDLGYISEEHLGINFYRWLYTAITRASNKLYLVNLPDEFE